MLFDRHATIAKVGPSFAARAAAHDAEGDFVSENYASLKERRAFSAMIPENLGGGGLPYSEMCHSFARYRSTVRPLLWRSPCISDCSSKPPPGSIRKRRT